MRRLYRSSTNRIIGGVCGGLGDYFKLDPVLIRLVWLIMIMFGGMGLILYAIAWVIIPVAENEAAEEAQPPRKGEGKGRFWWGLVLVVMGVILWGSQYRFIYWPTIPGVQIQSRNFVPIVLVLVGVYILYAFGRSASGKGWLYRSREDRKILGVCGGIADYFKIDSTLIRVLWVAGALFYGASIILYLVLMVALPERGAEGSEEEDSSQLKG